MKLSVLNEAGSNAADIEVADAVFAARFNEDLVHQLVVAYQAGGRSGTRAQKNRSAVRGGGSKPWRQKGTGRARAGTIRSPIWRGGGKAFPSANADFSQKLNKKMRRVGLRAIFSELLRQERLVTIDGIAMDSPKTKALLDKLNKFGTNDALIVTLEQDNNLALSARNLSKVDVCHVDDIDPVSLIGHEKVIMTADAAKRVAEMLA